MYGWLHPSALGNWGFLVSVVQVGMVIGISPERKIIFQRVRESAPMAIGERQLASQALYFFRIPGTFSQQEIRDAEARWSGMNQTLLHRAVAALPSVPLQDVPVGDVFVPEPPLSDEEVDSDGGGEGDDEMEESEESDEESEESDEESEESDEESEEDGSSDSSEVGEHPRIELAGFASGDTPVRVHVEGLVLNAGLRDVVDALAVTIVRNTGIADLRLFSMGRALSATPHAGTPPGSPGAGGADGMED